MEVKERHPAPRRHLARWLLPVLLCIGLGAVCLSPLAQELMARWRVLRLAAVQTPEWVDVELIQVDGTSRRGVELEDLKDVVIHYVGNPGTTAQQNRNWYENPASEVSSHFLVGLHGEVIQCLPLWERSSASNWRNADTISIEVCHPDSSGAFTAESYASLVALTAWLLEATGLDADRVIRHYDITGKECPKYFVENPECWQEFLTDVAEQTG